ncbi:hypothetical protein K6V72_19910 [Ralstonia insidiosa]|jgi:hypothetical protein|uniref:Uncharacterized protein n=1 Tax=Ralstonia insidiosa TaxID=190721 RepID=A0A191ZYW8_9RALS|nr:MULTISPECIES: hypothetical protein [Ralstonia]GAQ30054.1 putative uncharacterized protein [Ralstonia sp. NT80]ANH71320.1 hypothetical protein ACS15_2591 [Ralstonia insidiosa]ANJ73251.1 hypothetical protein A9Y76_12555 [Ralstonia insidiosa]KAB0473621.1 hypothetical protein F7R11_14105 [Ralstonia insidiosa]MBY4704955.1 hypothetical protein [Ralstonia insidiosa]
MLNKTVAVPVLSLMAMIAFTVWALLAGPADAAHAGERGVAPAGALPTAGACPAQCPVPAQKLAAR